MQKKTRNNKKQQKPLMTYLFPILFLTDLGFWSAILVMTKQTLWENFWSAWPKNVQCLHVFWLLMIACL